MYNNPRLERPEVEARKPVEGLGKRVRDRRHELGWAQRELAWRADIEPSKLSKIENDGGAIYASTLRNLAVALSVSADWLLGLSTDPHPKGLKK